MEFTVKLLGAVQLLLSWLLWPLFIILSSRPTPRLPAIKSPLLRLSATQLARKIRNREVKSRELVDVCIERIREVNPFVNAIVQERFVEAKKEADEVDEFISTNLENLEMIEREKPLLGVPFTVKESCALIGMSQAVGCLPLRGRIAPDDGIPVKALKEAGGIPIAVTNTPEFCFCWETNNLVTGCTKNPYNLHKTAGGSSGGEGALLGAGASIFGIGSDFAGSIRVPAMFNGIFGHKPSGGIVSVEGHFPTSNDVDFPNFLCIGPMTRHAEDLLLLMKIFTREKAELLDLDRKVDLSKIKVYYMEEACASLFAVPVDTEIKKLINDSASYMRTSYGCEVQKGSFHELENSVEIGGTVFLKMQDAPDLLNAGEQEGKEKLGLYTETLKAFFGLSKFARDSLLFLVFKDINLCIPKSTESYYVEQCEHLKNKFQEVLKDNGVFLYPTFPIPALNHGEIYTVMAAIMYPMIINVLKLPATHVPMGLNKNGLPIGIQVVAGPNQDRLCLAVAKALEEKFGGWVPPS